MGYFWPPQILQSWPLGVFLSLTARDLAHVGKEWGDKEPKANFCIANSFTTDTAGSHEQVPGRPGGAGCPSAFRTTGGGGTVTARKTTTLERGEAHPRVTDLGLHHSSRTY